MYLVPSRLEWTIIIQLEAFLFLHQLHLQIFKFIATTVFTDSIMAMAIINQIPPNFLIFLTEHQTT